jgi:hypothetical protein
MKSANYIIIPTKKLAQLIKSGIVICKDLEIIFVLNRTNRETFPEFRK